MTPIYTTNGLAVIDWVLQAVLSKNEKRKKAREKKKNSRTERGRPVARRIRRVLRQRDRSTIGGHKWRAAAEIGLEQWHKDKERENSQSRRELSGAPWVQRALRLTGQGPTRWQQRKAGGAVESLICGVQSGFAWPVGGGACDRMGREGDAGES